METGARLAKSLEGKSLIELRKEAKSRGIKNIAGLKSAELTRKIITASKPGGVDGRIKPKEAAEAASEAPARKGGRLGRGSKPKSDSEANGTVLKATDPERAKAKAEAAAEARSKPVEDMVDLIDRVQNLEKAVSALHEALVAADLMTPAKPVLHKPGTAEGVPPLLEGDILTENGELEITPEMLSAMNFHDMLRVNELVEQSYGESVEGADGMAKQPRKLELALGKLLTRLGVVVKDDSHPKNTPAVPHSADVVYPFPPESKGDLCKVKDDDLGWVPGALNGEPYEEAGETWYPVIYGEDHEEGPWELDVAVADLRKWRK